MSENVQLCSSLSRLSNTHTSFSARRPVPYIVYVVFSRAMFSRLDLEFLVCGALQLPFKLLLGEKVQWALGASARGKCS